MKMKIKLFLYSCYLRGTRTVNRPALNSSKEQKRRESTSQKVLEWAGEKVIKLFSFLHSVVSLSPV